MGICFIAYSIRSSNLALVRDDPALVWRVLESEDDISYLRQLDQDNKISLLQRLLGKSKPQRSPRTLDFAANELRVLDLDKAWDGIRACVKLCVPDAPDFFEGDGKIGDIEVGYGPALYVLHETIRQFAAVLDKLTEDDLLDKFRTADFKGVYLADLWKRRDEDGKTYLIESFRELHVFVKHCAAHQQAAILQLT